MPCSPRWTTRRRSGRRSGSAADRLRDSVLAAGGRAETAVVDALDEAAVDKHADAVAARAGGLDISFNLISFGDFQGTPLVDMPLDDYEQPVRTIVRTTFLTSRAAARHMIRQGSGVILFFGGYGDPAPNLGGLQIAFGAVEAFRRSLACELGPYGIRAVTLQTGGIPESIPDGVDGLEAVVAQSLGRRCSGERRPLTMSATWPPSPRRTTPAR